jgi:hypothetical protein
MVPLSEGEIPSEPAAARKRFIFRDAETGALRGITDVVSARERRPAAS